MKNGYILKNTRNILEARLQIKNGSEFQVNAIPLWLKLDSHLPKKFVLFASIKDL